MTSSEGFQQHFSIISKSVCCGFYMKNNIAFILISIAALKWDDCLSVQLPFEILVDGSDTGSVPSWARTKLTSSNVVEIEIELSRM